MQGKLLSAGNCLKHYTSSVYTHTPVMDAVYYIKLNTDKLEQKLIRHDYNTCQRSDLQFKFHGTYILKKVQISWRQN
jgi:hypothetical protein